MIQVLSGQSESADIARGGGRHGLVRWWRAAAEVARGAFLLDGRTIESITLNRRGFRTLSGAGVGDTLRRLKCIYGPRLKSAGLNIGGNPAYEIPAGPRKVRFDMYRGRVMFIAAGINSAVDAEEGCL